MLRACASLWAITASSTRPASSWSARNCSILSDMPSAPSALGRDEVHSSSRNHGVSAFSGSCVPGMWRSTMSVQVRLISSQRADIVLGRRMRLGQDLDGGLRIADREPGGGHVLGRGPELQHRLGDDAERAFGAHEQVLQVVAGVVLLERAQPVPDVAVGQHDFEAHARGCGRCRSAAPARRRRWSRGCRRSCTSPGRRGYSGKKRSWLAAVSCSVCSTQPASTVIE